MINYMMIKMLINVEDEHSRRQNLTILKVVSFINVAFNFIVYFLMSVINGLYNDCLAWWDWQFYFYAFVLLVAVLLISTKLDKFDCHVINKEKATALIILVVVTMISDYISRNNHFS